MAILSFIVDAWRDTFADLYIIGKIILFPLFAVVSIGSILFIVIEFFLIDIWVIVINALSKSMTVGSFFDFWFR